MTADTFESFTSTALAEGYDEVLERHWAPDTELALHTHNFDAHAVVIQGEMWLTCDGITRHLISGDTFTIGCQVAHSERYGSQGATYWVARKNSPTNNSPTTE